MVVAVVEQTIVAALMKMVKMVEVVVEEGGNILGLVVQQIREVQVL
jgi:hypothetical protein